MDAAEHNERYAKALAFAAEKHKGQVRKVSGKDFIEHPIAVAKILESHGASENVVIAGILHDILEDTPCSKEELERNFGEEVRTLVEECTDNRHGTEISKENWAERKARSIEKTKIITHDAVIIKIADKIANNQSIKEDMKKHRDTIWTYFNAGKEQTQRYQESMLNVFAERLGIEHSLVKKLVDSHIEVFSSGAHHSQEK